MDRNSKDNRTTAIREQKSCFGSSKKSPDLTGMNFGKLLVLGPSDKRAPRGKRTTPMWECRCECGAVVYRSTDTLKNDDCNMCRDCAKLFALENARLNAGFRDGTQISKICSQKPTASNTSGVRGVTLDRKTGRWRVRLKFQGKLMSFGS